MRAVVFPKAESDVLIKDIPVPQPQKGEVQIRIVSASLNRRDYWIKQGIYQGSKFPLVPGSDGSGYVEKVADEENEYLNGKEVIINPGLNWGVNPDYHQKDFEILGLPRQGTLAEYVCVPANHVYIKPKWMSFEKAAALPLGGLTAYRALFTRGNLIKGDNLLISGIGGGVATIMLKFGVSAGASVYVTSSSEKKIKRAIQLGAKAGVLYNDPHWHDQLAELIPQGFDLVVDSAGGNNFQHFFSLIRVGGRIVNFGGTAGQIPAFTPAKLFWKQASLLGTTMGSNDDFKKMLDWVTEKRIEPEIDKILPIEDTELAFKSMKNHEQFGKIVIKIS